MNQTQGFKVLTIKSLAIIGFLVTLALCVWLVVEGVRRAPEAFSSLASIIESVRGYRPVDELRLTTEKAVVNSGETFEISWTDAKQDGAYHFSYTCTPGVALAIRNEDNVPLPLRCTEVLDLPASVTGLTLSITSDTMRLTDVPLTIAFTNEARGISLESETRVTVANALIPVPDTTPVATSTPEKPEVATSTPAKPPVAVTPAPKPPVYTTTTVYPQSDPKGYIDLAVTTLGSGVIRNGVFTYTAKYDLDLKNAIKFDIKNIGTKTSGTWTFKTTLPSGQIFESPVQAALKPLEHVEFTLGFDLDTDDELVKITNKVYTSGDANAKNDSASWFVVVED